METKKKNGPSLKRIGEYAKADPEGLSRAVLRQQKIFQSGEKKRLGDLLVEEGLITDKQREEAVMKQRLDHLRFGDVFRGLNVEELMIISEFATEVTVAAGENFIFQDEMGDCFYMITEGEALVYRTGDYEEEVPLFVLKAGESIGEMGYFSDGCRLASARAVTKIQLLQIQYADLKLSLQQCHP
jgi:CRP-like cAMP-binding protein